MTTAVRSLTFACVCALVLGAAACSGSAPAGSEAEPSGSATPAASTAPAGALPHPCQILTQKDAEEVFGAGAVVKRDSDTACSLESARVMQEGLIEVKIEELPDTWDQGETAKMFDKDVQKVAIGDGGYTFMGGIIFKKGQQEVNVIATAYRGAKPKPEVVKFIAEKVAAYK